MEDEHKEGDVGREEVSAVGEPGQVGEAEREEQPQEAAPTKTSSEYLSRPACETPEEPATDRPERAEEDAGMEVPSPSLATGPAVPEVEAPPSFVGAAEEPAGQSLGEERPEAVSRDDQEQTDSAALEPARSEAVAAESGAEPEAPKPPKKRRARRKKTPQKRTDKARKKPAKKRSRKRPAKKREKSRT